MPQDRTAPPKESEWRAEPDYDNPRLVAPWRVVDKQGRVVASGRTEAGARQMAADHGKAALCEDLADWIEAQVPRIEGAGEAREWTGYEGIVDEGKALLAKAGRTPQ